MRRYFLFFAFSLALLGCEVKEQPVSKDEAIEFAERLEFGVKRKKSNAFDSVLNYDVFGKLVAKEADMKVNRSFLQGLETAIHQRLTKALVAVVENAGTYEFTRQYEKEGKQHVIFRLYSDNGINYHDMVLTKRGGKVKAADVYIFLSGENLSKSLGSLMNSFNEFSKKKSDQQANKLLESVGQIRSLVESKRYSEAKSLYDRLPTNIKNERVMMINNLEICSQLGEAEYMEALQDFEAKYSNDPSAQLTLLDSYIMKKEFTKALKAIDVLDTAVRRDPLLNFSRAIIYSQMNDLKNSVKCLEQLRKEKPGFENGLLELVAAYSQLNETGKGKQLVAEYRANKSLDQEKLNSILYLYPINE